MPTDYNKARKQKDASILDSLDSYPLDSTSQYGLSTPRRPNRRPSPASPGQGQAGTPSSFVNAPPEVLVHLFSFLDPAGFASANLVGREWHAVASDDYAWKAAFDRFFGTFAVIPRLSSTWRGEYIHRSHLLRFSTSFFLGSWWLTVSLGNGVSAEYPCHSMNVVWEEIN
jgi:hypothetical protein